MFASLLLSSTISLTPSANADTTFLQLQNQLESNGFQVNIALPPDFNLPSQKPDLQRSRVRKPYGVFNAASKSIWINPIVFDLGISNGVLIHETVHAAQFCAGRGKLQTLGLKIEPIQQARPFYYRYLDTHSQEIEKEAYAVQTQPNSLQLAMSLLKQYC
ncbi:MAG: hypothetical protein ACRC2S_19655 [Waterburya sp.]